MSKPKIYIDVDGVLNVLGGWDKSGLDWDDFNDHMCDRYKLWLSQQMADALMSLGVEIVWATSWCQNDMANTWISPIFGWDDLDSIGYNQFRNRDRNRGCGKLNDVLKHAGEDSFIWIDDCLDEHDRRAIKDRGVPCLLIQPDEYEGITKSHIEAMRTFIESASIGE